MSMSATENGHMQGVMKKMKLLLKKVEDQGHTINRLNSGMIEHMDIDDGGRDVRDSGLLKGGGAQGSGAKGGAISMGVRNNYLVVCATLLGMLYE